MTYYVAFDESHKPRGKIESNYRNLQRHLEGEGFVCHPFQEFPITQKTLQPYDCLVVPCPDFSKFSEQEIADIGHWVREDGGGLLMLSHAGGDKGRRSNLSELSEKFGMIFESDQVLDDKHNCGMGNLPQIKDFVMHPVSAGITELCFRAGCSLTVVGPAIAVASTGEEANPFSVPVIVAAECDEGRVVGMGSYEIFRDRIGSGFGEGQHAQLASNIFNWLMSDKRYQLRAQNKAPVPNPAGVAFAESEYAAGIVPAGNAGAPPSAVGLPAEVSPAASNYEVKTTVHINAKSELALELTRMLLEFENLKGRLEAVIRAVMQSPDVQEMAGAKPGIPAMPQYESFDEAGTDGASPQVSGPPPSFAPPPPKVSFTPIPQRPSAAPAAEGWGQPEGQPGEWGEGPMEGSQETPVAPAATEEFAATEVPAVVEPPVEEASKEDLETELEALQSKIISIKNLKGFVEKKYNDGKMDEESFKKQNRSLESDLKKTQYHIDEVEAKLKKLTE
ncbi:MAG TPA: hypothetical protein VKK79_00490 [Candidatus Lokiarchaeia archaeon]|nr:hypothetical protein [Candidatus Lokiarchaeia archaeon]